MKSIFIGVTGGIAAYKVPDFVRLLKKRGLSVRVAMTKSGERFVTPLVLETLSGQKVWTADWESEENPLDHLTESLDYSMAMIVPATANFIAKTAVGLADDFLSTLTLALTCPVYIAPAMNPRMYANIAVQDNLKRLKARGISVIEPDSGDTACGENGKGRLPQLDDLMAVVEKTLGLENDLAGLKILVTAGATEEPIDLVRYISNRSSGKMGIAIARVAKNRGADVTLVHGAVSEPLPKECNNVSVRTADEMYTAVDRQFGDCDVLVMTAAVADFRPEHFVDGKIKKDTASKTLKLEKNRDILKAMGKKTTHQLLVGFAAETENSVQNGKEKILKKNADLICVNDVSRSDIGFEHDYNQIIFIDRFGNVEKSSRRTKGALAQELIGKIVRLLGKDKKLSAGDSV